MLGEKLRAIYPYKSRPSNTSTPRSKTNFPLIPKEQHDHLSEEVKDISRQQHAFYHEQIKLLQMGGSTRPNNPNISVHFTHLMSLPEDLYNGDDKEILKKVKHIS